MIAFWAFFVYHWKNRIYVCTKYFLEDGWMVYTAEYRADKVSHPPAKVNVTETISWNLVQRVRFGSRYLCVYTMTSWNADLPTVTICISMYQLKIVNSLYIYIYHIILDPSTYSVLVLQVFDTLLIPEKHCTHTHNTHPKKKQKFPKWFILQEELYLFPLFLPTGRQQSLHPWPGIS